MQTIEQIGKRNNICDLQYIRMRIAKCPPDSVPEMVLAVDDKVSCPQIQKLCQNLKQKNRRPDSRGKLHHALLPDSFERKNQKAVYDDRIVTGLQKGNSRKRQQTEYQTGFLLCVGTQKNFQNCEERS